MLGASNTNIAGFSFFGKKNPTRTRSKAAFSNCSVLRMNKCRSSSPVTRKNTQKRSVEVDFNISLKKAWLVLTGTVVLSGVFYLYQVNALATKGYELRSLQKNLVVLEEDHKKGMIREVELMSMYNIEKATQDLDLVNLNDASYLEFSGPVAMK